MDNTAGLGVALAAMWSDDDHRYDHLAMLSALPNAPTNDRPTLRERVRTLWTTTLKSLATRVRPGAESEPWPTRTPAAAAPTTSPRATANSH